MLLPRSERALSSATPDEEAKVAEAVPGCILLVEDNEEVGNFAEALLGELGHGVVRARNGQEALKLAHGGMQFDLVFTDRSEGSRVGNEGGRTMRVREGQY